MDKIPYFNDSDRVAFIGGVMILPHDTGYVDPTLLPGYKPAEAGTALPADAPQHIVDILLQKPASDILAAIPTLAQEDLEQLGTREQEGAARKEILAAVAERLLNLASLNHDQMLQTASRGAGQVNGEKAQESEPAQDPASAQQVDPALQSAASEQATDDGAAQHQEVANQ